MKKKVISMLLVTSMAAAMFAGCGKDSGNGDSQTGNGGGDNVEMQQQMVPMKERQNLQAILRLECGAQKKTRQCSRK